MTAVDRVRRTQRVLGLVVGSSALMWGAAALLALLALGGLLTAYVALPVVMRAVLPAVAVLGGVATLGWLAWRGRFAWSFDRVALWIEERAPELRYALVTAIDPRYRDAAPVFEPIVARVDTGRFVRTAATQTVLPAAVALAVTLTAFMLMPASIRPPSLSDIFGPRAKKHTIIGNRLARISGTVTPPAYANLRQETLEEPSTITSLQGSRVMLTGEGEPDGDMHASLVMTDTAGKDVARDVPVVKGGKGWAVTFPMSDSVPAALKLVDRHYNRLVVINPIPDEPPAARLTLPQRDTTVRKIPETLHLSANLTDDIGIGTAYFEYIIANLGGGDEAEARVGKFPARAFGGSKSTTYALDIPYASLQLKEGDLFSVRAVVVDNNTLTGPDTGYSETRVIRVARASEYDSLNINPAPPSADTALITLRLLIMATEKWDKLQPTPKLGPDGAQTAVWKKWADSTIKLGGKADGVRQTIERIIDEQTGGGEVNANPLLTTARDAMWDASRSLYIGETGPAIPQMWVAYKALEKYKNEKRYYIRGVLPPIVVNIDRVRLAGDDHGKATPRTQPRGVEGADRDRWRLTYTQAVAYLKPQPQRAVEMLTMLQVQTLRTQPRLATALGDAVQAAKMGKDVTLPLLRARHELDGSAGAIDSLPVWSGSW